jgi:hypothetical protein
MTILHRSLLIAAVLLAAPLLQARAAEAQPSESAIVTQIKTLRSLNATQRPLTTIKLAQDVASLPPGLPKVRLADALASLVTEGDQGRMRFNPSPPHSPKPLPNRPSPPKATSRQSPISISPASYVTSRSQ